ncbi:uncharacterized protein B0I36DRAFT_367832 [Microdochium trichocladiopsis]|uniref:Uncharacterized protein n=1 Tax=Microdochium trichocladiopsis TaxID=1682393 RepID=A0A9P9BKM9_9PEZI|nr:uncharacterized protein B0I36DRAFT_367832 [Microdochium trichocladiopsis]KAH7021419.1 hypothetical protein B0I36DRAFT_367832 [Microdochium trichocladiopsis]
MTPITPDRFVPSRTREPLADRFRTTKSPLVLSPAERLSRTEDAGPDVFLHRPPQSAPAMLPPRRAIRSADPGPSIAGTTLNLRPVPVSAPDRQVSHGTIYARSQVEQDQENHEGRLALALKMDRASRMLDFDGRLTFPRCRSKTTTRSRLDQKTA